MMIEYLRGNRIARTVRRAWSTPTLRKTGRIYNKKEVSSFGSSLCIYTWKNGTVDEERFWRWKVQNTVSRGTDRETRNRGSGVDAPVAARFHASCRSRTLRFTTKVDDQRIHLCIEASTEKKSVDAADAIFFAQ